VGAAMPSAMESRRDSKNTGKKHHFYSQKLK
jgi:hypothetical protein